MRSNLTLSTLYKKEYIYQLDKEDTSLSPLTVIFRALSLRELNLIRDLESISESNQVDLLIIELGVIKFINVIDTNGKHIADVSISDINKKYIKLIADNIMEVSLVTAEVLRKMQLNIILATDKKFQTDTWDCDVCRSKELDKSRNCKFRPDYEKEFKDDFSVLVGDETYTHCPMFYKDEPLLSDMFTSYNASDNGVLPDAGGLVDQTEFFSYATNMVRKEVNNRNKEE